MATTHDTGPWRWRIILLVIATAVTVWYIMWCRMLAGADAGAERACLSGAAGGEARIRSLRGCES